MQTTSLNHKKKRYFTLVSVSHISIKVYTEIPTKDVCYTVTLLIEHLFIQPIHRSLFGALKITDNIL